MKKSRLRYLRIRDIDSDSSCQRINLSENAQNSALPVSSIG